MGWLTASYPVRLVLPEDQDPGAALKAIKEQVRAVPGAGLGYGVLRRGPAPSGDLSSDRIEPQILFNYLGNLDRARPQPHPFRLLAATDPSDRSPLSERPHGLEINARVQDGRLRVQWTYDSGAYRTETVEALARAYLDALDRLVDQCLGVEDGSFTPSDFPEAELSQDELDRLLGGP